MTDTTSTSDDYELVLEQDVARLFRVTDRTLRRWRTLGIGPAYTKIGRKVFYTRRAIHAGIAAQERAPGPQVRP